MKAAAYKIGQNWKVCFLAVALSILIMGQSCWIALGSAPPVKSRVLKTKPPLVSPVKPKQGSKTSQKASASQKARQAKPSSPPANSGQALINAVKSGNLKETRRLLASGVSPNAEESSGGKWSALMYASYYGYTDIMRELIAKGADVNLKEKRNQRGALAAAIMGNRIEAVKVLLEAGVNPPFISNALADTVRRDQIEIARLLLAAGGNPHYSTHGLSAMELAAGGGKVEFIKMFLEAGTPADPADADAGTPLLQACLYKQLPVVKQLLRAGANPNARTSDVDSYTPLHYVFEWPADKELATTVEEIVQALVRAGANINARNSRGETPLIMAVRLNRPASAVKVLLASGADPNIKDNEDNTALTYALQNKNSELVSLLRQAGARE